MTLACHHSLAEGVTGWLDWSQLAHGDGGGSGPIITVQLSPPFKNVCFISLGAIITANYSSVWLLPEINIVVVHIRVSGLKERREGEVWWARFVEVCMLSTPTSYSRSMGA